MSTTRSSTKAELSSARTAEKRHSGVLGADCGYSNAKIFFQSFFMLMTVQPFFFASS